MISPQIIECGYEERREEASCTLFFKKQDATGEHEYPTLINVFYTTRGVMTKLSHPRNGYNQLWRSSAYDSEETLRAIFEYPRKHTGKGYRTADKAKRGCISCGLLKERNEFSKNQWRKGPGDSKCVSCVQDARHMREQGRGINTGSGETTSSAQLSTDLPVLFFADQWFIDICGDVVNDPKNVVLTTESLVNNPSQAEISNVSQKFRGVVITDDWFDVDGEYRALATSIFRVLKDMYLAGGTVVIAATMGVFTVPRQISEMFSFDSPWEYKAYTRMSLITTHLGREILGDAFPEKSVYTKANFIKTSPEECLFQEHINPEDYEDYSDEEVPNPIKDSSPIVRHCASNGGKVFYFGFVSEDGFKWGTIIMKLMQPVSQERSPQSQRQGETDSSQPDISYECIPCDEESCTNLGASISCHACKMTFYCSEKCQSRHKRAHIHECRVGATMRERFAMQQKEPPQEVRRGAAMAAMLAGRHDFQGRLLQAEYWQYEDNWRGAFDVYKDLYIEMENRSPPEQRQVIMGISRCFYEMKAYDNAIAVGESAIGMNRHFPEVHKYVALSYKEKGDIDTAIATMIKAVLYETPWDDENIEANKALLMEMKRG